MTEHLVTSMQWQYFILLFAGLWLGLTALLSHMGGWASLARKYRTNEAARGERFRFVSGRMGRFVPVSYNYCLDVVVNADGIRLSVSFPLRFLSPPLYVPWRDVESVYKRRFLFSHAVITIKGQWPRIFLWGRAGEAVLRLHGAR